MTDTLSVTVNEQEHAIPADFGSTPAAFAAACGYNTNREWRVYRQADPRMDLTADDRCDEPMAVDDGDRFVIIPRYIDGG